VPGSGNSDSVLAWLTPGEVVLPKPVLAAGRVNEYLAGLRLDLPLPKLAPGAAIPGFRAGGVVPALEANETITIDFTIGGSRYPGRFDATVGRALAAELRRAAGRNAAPA
jgi:hypothetical protein